MPDIWALMRAIRKSDLSAPERHTLLTLTSLVDPKTGLIPERFQPSLTDLTRFTKLGRSTIVRSLNAAEDGGWIKRTVPNKKAAQIKKEKTSYVLLIPADALCDDDEDPDGASATVALVPEGDQPEGWCQGGPSATVALGLVPPWDGASATVGHEVTEPCEPVNQPPPSEEDARTEQADLGALFAMTGAGGARQSGSNGTKVAAKKASAKHKRLSRAITKNPETLDADWHASEAMLAWAKENTPDVIARLATAKFLSHFADSGKRFKDWDRAWRNWLLTDQQELEQRNKGSQSAQGPTQSNYQGRRGGSTYVRMKNSHSPDRNYDEEP